MTQLSPMYTEIADLVVHHYRKTKRDLPWRRSRDPYRIWISEIMLQQTRVTTVIPYYEQWLTRFPTVNALADAPLDDVLARWSGLGYYSRARNIHRSAREIQQRYNGTLPQTATDLRTLPGIGRYTAGAIASIAYSLKEPLVDGNVARLFARVFELKENIKSTSAINKLWKLCADIVPESAPGEFNQGLMEIGSLICTPKNPRCAACPLQSICLAKKHGTTEILPIVAKRQSNADKQLLQTDAIFVVRETKILLAQRSPRGLFGGLWEFPQSSQKDHLGVLTSLNLQFHTTAPALVHEQVLSHRRLRIQVWPATATGRSRLGASESYQQLCWHRFSDLPTLGISSATKSILRKRKELVFASKG